MKRENKEKGEEEENKEDEAEEEEGEKRDGDIGMKGREYMAVHGVCMTLIVSSIAMWQRTPTGV